MATSLQFALCNAVTGMENEFVNWYGTEHLEHVLSVPGINAGQMFHRVTGPFPPGKHDFMMIWEFDSPQYALTQLAEAKGSTQMPISPALDFQNVQPPTMWIRATIRSAARIATDTEQRGPLVLALLNAEKDQYDRFEEDILQTHLRQIADLPAVQAASFLTLARQQIRGSARKYRCAVLVELDNEAAGLQQLADVIPALPLLDQERWIAPVFRPNGKRTLKPLNH